MIAAPATVSLSPYTGEWTHTQAAHLLRRTTFGPTKAEMDEAVSLGLDGAVDRLLADIELPDAPVYYDYEGHPDATIGDSWVDLYLHRADRREDQQARIRSLDSWFLLSTAQGGGNIRDKMMIFWLNHFGMSGINDGRLIYDFVTTYRRYATGNVRQLIKEMTIHPYMLIFLDGNLNRVGQPNENFAREVLELFTVGKGPQVGEDDYTHYTEQDVVEMARCFTGWRARNVNSVDPTRHPESFFAAARHDTGRKQLSHRFGNRVIENGGAEEYATVIDLIFEKDEVAAHLCRKLYRYFVYYHIDETVEAEVIQPMARVLIDNDYDLRPALAALLRSDHFYQTTIIGSLIKNPLEFVHSVLRPVGWYDRAEVPVRYGVVRPLNRHLNLTGMQLRIPPTVAGWTAYYQAPAYHRLWLNGSTMQLRVDLQRQLTTRWLNINRRRVYVDWLGLLEDFTAPGDPNALIHELSDRFLPQGINEEQHTALKDLLLPGLEDFVWTNEYALYRESPNDEELIRSVRGRLTEMVFGLLQLAEFQLT